jgi:4-hydroxythreonine-4-phosphate dehydrogenase
MSLEDKKRPVIGITMGDVNGVGPQVILKALEDERIFKHCQIVVFGSESVVQFYKKTLPNIKTNFHVLQKQSEFKLHAKLPTLIECADKPVEVNMGVSNEFSGSLSLRFINDALFFLQQNKIDILVTGPVNKAFITTNPPFSGHTEYLAQKANTKDTLMVMNADALRVAMVTQHIPLEDVSKTLTTQLIYEKIKLFNQSLTMDFGCQRPKIAILALNPHGGENGKIGKDEIEKISPAIKKAEDEKIIVQGPFSADSFFGSAKFPNFDGILAMYHDQALIPFKYISGWDGVNFTANLPYIRTSPDHGVALDIVGTDAVDSNSMYNAITNALDIYHMRARQKSMRENPLPKINLKNLERN